VAGVEIINLSRTPWSVRVELRRDDEVVWSETESVAIDEQRPLECTWPRTPGEYTIAARLDSGDGRVERPLADADGADADGGQGRVGAFVVVGLRESISVEVTDGYARPAGFSGACE